MGEGVYWGMGVYGGCGMGGGRYGWGGGVDVLTLGWDEGRVGKT